MQNIRNSTKFTVKLAEISSKIRPNWVPFDAVFGEITPGPLEVAVWVPDKYDWTRWLQLDERNPTRYATMASDQNWLRTRLPQLFGPHRLAGLEPQTGPIIGSMRDHLLTRCIRALSETT